MAGMSIDDSALRDPRMLRLAKRLGWSPKQTVGTLIWVWAVCYDRVTPYLPPEDVDTAADLDGFADAMMAVDLAVDTPEGLWIRGVAKRIKYLEEAVESGRRGGQESARKRKERNETAASLKGGLEQPQGSSNLPVPVLLPVPVPDLQKLSPARDPSTPAPVQQTPAETFSFDAHSTTVVTAWSYHVERFASCQQDGIETGARAPNALPMGDAELQLSQRINEMRAKGSSYADCARELRHRIDVAEAESRREKHLRWFKPSKLWAKADFWRAFETTVAQAAEKRAPARASPGAIGPSKPHADHPVSASIEGF